MAKSKLQFYMGLGNTGHEAHWSYCFYFVIIIGGFLTLLVWLSNAPEEPIVSVEQFYAPALNTTANDPLNTTVTFDLQLKNPGTRIHYGAINVTLYYGHNLSSFVGNVTIPGFRQGHQKKTHRTETVETIGVPWKTAVEEVSKGTAVFRLELTTMVKYTVFSVKGNRHEMRVGADVNVNDQGIKSRHKGIKLSSASTHNSYCAPIGIVLLLVLFFI